MSCSCSSAVCTVQYTEPDLVAALNCGFIFYNSWDSSLDPMLRRSGAPLVFTEYYLQVRPPSGQTIQDFLFLHPSTGLPTEPGESAEEHKEGCDRNPAPDREPLLQQVSVSVCGRRLHRPAPGSLLGYRPASG